MINNKQVSFSFLKLCLSFFCDCFHFTSTRLQTSIIVTMNSSVFWLVSKLTPPECGIPKQALFATDVQLLLFSSNEVKPANSC